MDDNIVASLRYSAEWIKEMEYESWLGTAELQIEAADAIQQRDAEIERLRAEVERLRALVDDYENGISWYTTCTNCAKLMDVNYDQYCQIERLRAAGDALAINYELMLEQDWSSFLEAFLHAWREARRER